jgi:SAM-dependent methyltransferase
MESAVAEHDALVARTLRIPLQAWLEIRESLPPPSGDVQERVAQLRQAFRKRYPPLAVPSTEGAACPACGGRCAPLLRTEAELIYGRCGDCGHGLLLSSPPADALYRQRDYYERKSAAGAGYDDYAAERAYREQRGRALVERMLAAHGGSPQMLLEVGSGFGFTLASARAMSLSTFAVDVSPHAGAAARELYGVETFVGTLAQALQTQFVCADLVLYQFVLEHLADPLAELSTARSALASDGVLCLVVPSMEALELDVFGAAYRSLRVDHLHLFSARSMARLLERANLTVRSMVSTCNLHLLRAVLSEVELAALYASGKGPDLIVMAQRNDA